MARQKGALIFESRVQPSTSGEVEQTCFPLFFPLGTIKDNKYYMENKHQENINSGEKSDQLGIWGPERHGDEVPGFSFCLIYSRLGAEELTTPKYQQAQAKENNNN